MGHTVASVKVYNPREESLEDELELLVDTGLTYSWIRRERLAKIGVKSIGRGGLEA